MREATNSTPNIAARNWQIEVPPISKKPPQPAKAAIAQSKKKIAVFIIPQPYPTSGASAMKKSDKHELLCGCQTCKPTSRALVILKPGELPLLEREEAGAAETAPSPATQGDSAPGHDPRRPLSRC